MQNSKSFFIARLYFEEKEIEQWSILKWRLMEKNGQIEIYFLPKTSFLL
jgi:hypothetical protein